MCLKNSDKLSMDINELVNKTFTEDEIFELLVFEVEENFEKYLGKHCHLNFEPLGEEQIRITELLTFNDADEAHIVNRTNLDKNNWLEITDNFGHVDVVLTHADRSHRFAIIYKDKETYYQSGRSYCFLDEYDDLTPLTEEEMRQGFAELAGCLEAYSKSKSKIAV